MPLILVEYSELCILTIFNKPIRASFWNSIYIYFLYIHVLKKIYSKYWDLTIFSDSILKSYFLIHSFPLSFATL